MNSIILISVVIILSLLFAAKLIAQSSQSNERNAITKQGTEYNTIQTTSPTMDAAAQAAAGATALRSGDFTNAINIFLSLSTKYPSEAGFHNNLAFAQFSQGKKVANAGNQTEAQELFQSAIREMNKAIELQPNNPGFYKTSSFIKRAAGDVTADMDAKRAEKFGE